jgi:hypothetical protein
LFGEKEKNFCPIHLQNVDPSPQFSGDIYKEPKEYIKKEISRSEFCKKFLEKRELKVDIKQTKPRTLSEFFPLKQELYDQIISNSQKNYRIEFVEQLLQKLASKYKTHEFKNEKCFISYMSKALDNELIRENIANLEDFQLTGHYRKNKDIENYLCKIELYQNTDHLSRLKRKIAAIFDPEVAYKLLTSCNFPENRVGECYKIKIIKSDIELDSFEQYHEALFHEITNIFGNEVKEIKFILDSSLLPEEKHPIWQKAREQLKEICGVPTDKSWFSKLDIGNIDRTNNLLEIIAPTQFIKDWVKANFFNDIKKVLREILPDIEDVRLVIENVDKPYIERGVGEISNLPIQNIWEKIMLSFKTRYKEYEWIFWNKEISVHNVSISKISLYVKTKEIYNMLKQKYLYFIETCAKEDFHINEVEILVEEDCRIPMTLYS